MRPDPASSSRRSALVLAALAGTTFLVGACGGGASEPLPPDVISRETFIAAYVDLRAAAVATEDFVIPDEERSRILSSHGIEGEALLRFAAARGRDLEFMREVWSEIEVRLDERTSGAEPR